MDGDPWVEYARLQVTLKRTTDACKAAGIEAAMASLLDKIEHNEACKPKQVQNLLMNRIRKELRHRAIVYAGRYELCIEQAPQDAAESRLVLIKCMEACGERDFSLLVCQAQGYTFREMAAATGVNSNTLKTWVHRSRKKIFALAA